MASNVVIIDDQQLNSIDVRLLPDDVKAKLAELELELSEGDITEKGFSKKRSRLLSPYIKLQQPQPVHKSHDDTAQASSPNSQIPVPVSAAQRRLRRRATRNDNRHMSEIRIEVVKEALYKYNGKDAQNQQILAPVPLRRASQYQHRNSSEVSALAGANTTGTNQSIGTDSSSDEDVTWEVSESQVQATPPPRHHVDLTPPTPGQADPAESSSGAEQAGLRQQPPDLTRNTHSAIVDNQHRSRDSGGSHHAPSVRMRDVVNIDPNLEARPHGKVSAKIQQLLNTLKRPKRRPMQDFFREEDDGIQLPSVDPSAPKPERDFVSPLVGEPLAVPARLPRNFFEALQRYGSESTNANKQPAFTVVDQQSKPAQTITYGKFFTRCLKVAYSLTRCSNPTTKNSPTISAGDRVALVFPNNDPIGFCIAYFAALFACLVPVPIEVPTLKRDADRGSVGFLLSALQVRVAISSDPCIKGLPRTSTGDLVYLKSWPKLAWLSLEQLQKSSPKADWSPPLRTEQSGDDEPRYIEYTTDPDGTVLGVAHSHNTMISHCKALTSSCGYEEAEVLVSVLDHKREFGLWHSVLNSTMNGSHVIFVPYSVMKIDPAVWMKFVTRYNASVALVKSRDLYWALQATRDHADVNFTSLRLLLISDGSNPWSLTSCEQFLKRFQSRGLKPESVCPAAGSPEGLTVAVRRPGLLNCSASVRGVLSLSAISHGVIRAEAEGSLNSMTLQDCGQVLPGAKLVPVNLHGEALVCQADQVGELCLAAPYTPIGYFGLPGRSKSTFKVRPTYPDLRPASEQSFVRTGLLGFFHKSNDVSSDLVFVCGSKSGLMEVTGRRHNTDDIIATVLAVEPLKFVYRGRIAVFTENVLRDGRIIIIAEQKPDCSEEQSFEWMSRILQVIDTIHQVGIYCLALVPPNTLPRTPLGGLHIPETKRRFRESALHPTNVLMCPHTCVVNLPPVREFHSGGVGPSAMHVGNIVQGARIAVAQGREMPPVQDDTRVTAFLTDSLAYRAKTSPNHLLYSAFNSKGVVQSEITCAQLARRSEKLCSFLRDKCHFEAGTHIALIFPASIEFVCAFYGCLQAGLVPVPVRPPLTTNLATTLPTTKMIVEVAQCRAILTNATLQKIFKSKEAIGLLGGPNNNLSSLPIIDSDSVISKSRAKSGGPSTGHCRPLSPDVVCYLDFSVSPTGTLAGVKLTHSVVTSICRAIKLQCELYPSRDILLSLDAYSGLGLVLLCLVGVFCGHHTILVPPSEVEQNPSVMLMTACQLKIRDLFCSYGVMELCSKAASSVDRLKTTGLDLSCIRTCIAVAEERPRLQLIQTFCRTFGCVGLNPRSVSTSFGCRVNLAIGLQGSSSPDPSPVFLDSKSLRHDRVALVEKGSPNSFCLAESGKLLPGVRIIIANPETLGPCADSHLGEIWVQSPHNCAGYYQVYGQHSELADSFSARLEIGAHPDDLWARTGYLGFVRHTNLKQSNGERHDAIYVVGSLDEAILLRGMRYHPIDIETSVLRVSAKICECVVFTWFNLLVCVVELDAPEITALDLIPVITTTILEEHHLIVGVIVICDPGVVPINSRGEKQRMHLRDGFLNDHLDPIYVAYNM